MAFTVPSAKGTPTIAELLDFKNRIRLFADAPAQTGTLAAIVGTRCAIDIDHLARLISSPAIDVGSFWVQVEPKGKAKRKLRRKPK